MATAIPIPLDGELRQPKVVVCAMGIWKSKTAISIYCSIMLFLYPSTEKIADVKTNIRRYKAVFYEICQKHKAVIRYMEIDKFSIMQNSFLQVFLYPKVKHEIYWDKENF